MSYDPYQDYNFDNYDDGSGDYSQSYSPSSSGDPYADYWSGAQTNYQAPAQSQFTPDDYSTPQYQAPFQPDNYGFSPDNYSQPVQQPTIEQVAGPVQPQHQDFRWWGSDIPLVGGFGNWVGNIGSNLFPGGQVTFRNPFDLGNENLWDLANQATSRLMGGLGAAVAPVGGSIEQVADSDVPVASQAAQGVRGVWENAAEPIFNFTPSIIGDLSKGQFPGVISDIGREIFDRDNLTQDYQQRKQQAVQDAYNSVIQNGGTEEEAQRAMDAANRKYSNPANLAEYQGVQRFGQLPAIAQLGTMFLDPVANTGGELLLAGKLPGRLGETKLGGAIENVTSRIAPVPLAQSGIETLANATGLTPAARALSRAVESPEQRMNAFDIYSNIATGEQGGARNLASYAEANGKTFMEAGNDFLDPNSPVYYKNFYTENPQLGEKVAQQVRDVLDDQLRMQYEKEAQPLAPARDIEASRNEQSSPLPYETPLTEDLSKEYKTERVQAAGDMYSALKENPPTSFDDWVTKQTTEVPGDTVAQAAKSDWSLEGAFPQREGESLAEYNKRLDYIKSRAGTLPAPLTEADRAANVKGVEDFTKIGEAKPPTLSEERLKEIEYLKPLKIPDLTGSTLGEGWQYVRKGYEITAGKAKLIENPITKELEVRQMPTMYKLGPVGSALRVIGKPVGYLSEVYLKRPGRMIRDVVGNIVKYVGENYHVRGFNARYTRAKELGMQPQNMLGGISHDLNSRGSQGHLARAFYFLQDVQTGFANYAFKKFAKSKVAPKWDWLRKSEDLNAGTENFEATIKNGVFSTDYLRFHDRFTQQWVKDNLAKIDQAPLSDSLKAKIKDGTISEKELNDWVSGRMIGVPLTDAIQGNFHPLMMSDALRDLRQTLEHTKFQPILNMLDARQLDQELAAFNKARESYLRYRRGSKAAEQAGQAKNPLEPQTWANMAPDSDFFFGLRDNGELVGRRGKPIYEGFFNKLDRALREMYEGQTVKERALVAADKTLDAQSEALLTYVNNERAMPRLTHQLKIWQKREEVAYAVHYNLDVIDKAMLREKGARAPVKQQNRITAYYNHLYGDKRGDFDLAARTHELTHFGSAKLANRQQWLTALRKADQDVRDVTANRFKLDYDLMEVVENGGRGRLLRDMYNAHRGNPAAHVDLPEPFKPKPVRELTSLDDAVAATNKVLDEFGIGPDKKWADLDPLEAGQLQSRLALELNGTDPHNPMVGIPALDHQYRQAFDFVDQLKQDIVGRAEQNQAKVREARQTQAAKSAEVEAANMQAQKESQEFANWVMQGRYEINAKSQAQAYAHTSQLYFDYKDKNLLDQALGAVFPFNYWARQNFTYLATHYFTEHPYTFAAMVHFYQQLEQENREQGIPGFARGNLLLWTNPDGSKVLWNFSTMFPFTAGDASSPMQLVTPEESDYSNHINKQPLAMLMGFDVYNAGGKRTDREKGILPNFIRPNPIFDIPMKMGLVNKFTDALGITNDWFGSAGPTQKQTVGLLAGASSEKAMSAAIGLTQALRSIGVPITDLDVEGPINEMLFGKGAGKPWSKVNQELARMVATGQLDRMSAERAFSDLKNGVVTPIGLKVLDQVEAEDASRSFLSMAGLSTVVTNTPRSESANKAYGQFGKYYQALKDAQTPDQKQAAQKALNDWMGSGLGNSYEVLRLSGQSPEQMQTTVADDMTRWKYGELIQLKKDKQLTQAEYNTRLATLTGENPGYFQRLAEANPAKAQQQAADQQYFTLMEQRKKLEGNYQELMKMAQDAKAAGDTKAYSAILNSRQVRLARDAMEQFDNTYPDFAARYQAYNQAKYGTKPKSEADRVYEEKQSQYYAIGGDRYDELTNTIDRLMAAGQKGQAAKILSSAEYNRIRAARDQYLLDNPDFYARKNSEQVAKYGKPLQIKTSYAGSGAGGTAGTNRSTTTKRATTSYRGSVPTTTKRAPTAPAATNRYYSNSTIEAVAKGGGAKSTSGGSTPASGGSTTFTPAQKRAYAQQLAAGYSKQQAASYANKVGGGAASGNKTLTPFTPAQKKYYAKKLAQGWTKQHAAAAARKINS